MSNNAEATRRIIALVSRIAKDQDMPLGHILIDTGADGANFQLRG
jgi:hypothetical protein